MDKGYTIDLNNFLKNEGLNFLIENNLFKSFIKSILVAKMTSHIELDDELIAEGLARELVNKIQQQRKLANFNVSDRIRLSIQSTQIVQDAFDQYRSYVTSETLTAEVASGDTFSDKSFAKQYSINGESTEIRIEQITTG